MVYLVKDNGMVRAFYSENEMIAAGFSMAEKIVTDEEFNGNGCYARIIEDEIVVGKTEDEIAEEEKRKQIVDIEAQLATLDREYLTPRILAGIAQGDAYSIGKAQEHEQLAIPLRATWRELKGYPQSQEQVE